MLKANVNIRISKVQNKESINNYLQYIVVFRLGIYKSVWTIPTSANKCSTKNPIAFDQTICRLKLKSVPIWDGRIGVLAPISFSFLSSSSCVRNCIAASCVTATDGSSVVISLSNSSSLTLGVVACFRCRCTNFGEFESATMVEIGCNRKKKTFTFNY